MVTLLPNHAFSRHIDRYWYAENGGGNGDLISEYYPDGNTDLLFEFSPTRCKLCLFGPARMKALIKTGRDCSYLSIRFRPGKFPRHNDIDPASLVDQYIEPTHIFGQEVDLLGGRLHHASSFLKKIRLIETAIGDFGVHRGADIPTDQQAVEALESTDGLQSIKTTADGLGISLRQFERKVVHLVGVAPKTLARFLRLQKILTILFNGWPHRLTDLAYLAGYADQAHFIYDFKALTGISPKHFVQTDRIDSRITILADSHQIKHDARIFHCI